MTLRPPPPRRAPRPPPALIDDAMREIFLRLPADDPGSLVRAAAVCRSWYGILSDAAFARDYRAFRRAPPMLGFLHNERHTEYTRLNYWVSHFVSTATFSPPAFQDREHCHVLDSRHGLVLLYTPGTGEDFVVCDLVTHDEWRIHADPKCHDIMWWEDSENVYDGMRLTPNAAVLCDKDLCDHLDCHGGPFLVALVGSDDIEGLTALATVYSSKTREWSDMISVHSQDFIDGRGHSAVVGNKVYVPGVGSSCVLEYNMGEQELSVIDVPYEDQDKSQHYVDLMGVEDGLLLFASVMKPRLYLWSMEAGPSGAAGWARRRFIELEPLLPRPVLLDNSTVSAVGFAEGVGVIFLSTEAGLYTIELSSGRCDQVNEEGHIEKAMPYMSFYIGGTD